MSNTVKSILTALLLRAFAALLYVPSFQNVIVVCAVGPIGTCDELTDKLFLKMRAFIVKEHNKLLVIYTNDLTVKRDQLLKWDLFGHVVPFIVRLHSRASAAYLRLIAKHHRPFGKRGVARLYLLLGGIELYEGVSANS